VDDLSGAHDHAGQDDRLRSGSFGAVAAAYAEHRPGYAEDAVRWALEPVSGHQPLRVLDLAAGTGKLTAALADLSTKVSAVEPDPAMLAELQRRLPEVPALAGRAEEIPLPDGSVDAVLAGQAMHWFDLDRAVPEIARVLVPGGVLAGLWNVDDDLVDWVAALGQISQGKSNRTLRNWRAGTGPSHLTAAVTGLFETPQLAEFANGQLRTADSLVATVGTHSSFLVMPEPDRSALLAQVRDLLSSRPETAAGEFVFPLVTVVQRATRKP
jgi:SAM-dependent methyltransferase